ncbi:uncharacterized protein VTP21DRAFT_2156 [Calcarisporiella thermophila]|uniref:uncharacterized protein n=1 Tax=Calcarisporiella thermophila TaxID=911321 RepID=UPI003742D707
MSAEFVLHDELLKLQEGSYYIPNEIDVTSLNDKEIDRHLNNVVDHIEENSNSISNLDVFDILRSFLKEFKSLKPATANRLFDIILSGFVKEIHATSSDIEADDQDVIEEHRLALEMYGFLLQWFIAGAEGKATSSVSGDKPVGTSRSKRGKAAKSSGGDEERHWDWSSQIQKSLDVMARALEIRLNKIWTSTHERDNFVGLFTKPIYQLLENQANTQTPGIKSRAFKVLAICIQKYNHTFAAQTTLMQYLQYHEHAGEPIAELLYLLADKFDNTQLMNEMLREISQKEFKDITTKELKDTANTKTFTKFLIRLSELCPKQVLRQAGLLIRHLDSESYQMRCAIIEIVGNLVIELANSGEQNDITRKQIGSLFDVLEERFLDANAFVRSKVLQSYLRILDLQTKFPKRRQKLCDLAVRHLEDKSSHVRKYAIKVLTRTIATHPYGMHGGELVLEEWQERLKGVKEQLDAIASPNEIKETEAMNEQPSVQNGHATNDETAKENEPNSRETEKDEDVEMEDADEDSSEKGEKEKQHQKTEKEAAEENNQIVIPAGSAEDYMKLQLMRRFYVDAIRFIEQIHSAIPVLCQLLASTNKAEVMEAMDFFVVALSYKIELAEDGIKKMLHLIWVKENNDEAKGVRTRLLDSYRTLYLEPLANQSHKENVNMIARNLIKLTFNTTLAELTSLEQVLSTLMADGRISDVVVEKLWAVYGVTKLQIPKAQRRGAIIILAMLAKAKREVVSEKVDLLLRIGLSSYGKNDLSLARYSCIALQSIAGNQKKEKGSLTNQGFRLPPSNPIFDKLLEIIEEPTTSTEWFGLAEQAINTIYLLAEHPDRLCGQLVKRKTVQLFDLQRQKSEARSTTEGQEENSDPMDEDPAPTSATSQIPVPQVDAFKLSQLCFIVGHVAIRQIVHLELIEVELKRRKAKSEAEKEKKAERLKDDELDQVAGTAEDDYGEAISAIREKELLSGSSSLLAVYGPMLAHICSNTKLYSDRMLQTTATLALSKFMCVSEEFCETHLPLLLTILDRSQDATIRSDIVIALGDMAVCFNNLIDENISHLYRRLSDPDGVVKKNALMVLTHLILNGMVKVKGQIGEMARCLEDEDTRISDLAKLFFTELATKDNAIYNNLPDIISNLSAAKAEVEEETFRRIMRFLFGFIDKERQAENVVEKLCQRFRNLEREREWRDIAFCLSLLPYKSEKSFKRLLEGISLFQDKLHEETVAKYFAEIVNKGRAQKMQKPEMRAIIDEFESRLEEIKRRGMEREEETKEESEAQDVEKGEGEKGEAVDAETENLKPAKDSGTKTTRKKTTGRSTGRRTTQSSTAAATTTRATRSSRRKG